MAKRITVRQLIEQLQLDYDPNELVVADVRSLSDLLSANEDVGKPFSEERVQELWVDSASEYTKNYLNVVVSDLPEALVRFLAQERYLETHQTKDNV